MKKIILTLVCAAGLTQFEGSAKANDYTVDILPSDNIAKAYISAWNIGLNNTASFLWGQSYASFQANNLSQIFISLSPQIPTATGFIFAGYDNSGTHAIVSSQSILSGTWDFNFAPFLEVNIINDISLGGNVELNNFEFYFNKKLLCQLVGNVADAKLYEFSSAVDIGTFKVTLQSAPEPSTYALFGIGTIGLLMVLRRKKAA